MRNLLFRGTRATAAVLAVGWLCACGGSDGNATPDGGSPDGAAPDGAIVVPDGPVRFEERLLGFDPLKGFVVAAGKRMLSFADALSPSLKAITVVGLDGTKATVSTVPVSGTIPAGHIESIAYDPGSDAIVMIVRAQRPHRIEVVRVTVSDTAATFTTLTQSQTLAPDGYMFTALYASGGGFVGVRGDVLLPFTIAGSALTWGASMPASSFSLAMSSALSAAPTEGGLYAYGKSVYDPVQKKLVIQPIVMKNVPVGPSWTDVALGGTPPPVDTSNPNPVGGFSAYDAKGKRLLVSALHDVTPCPPPQTVCKAPGLYIADMAKNTWVAGPEFFSTFGYVQSPWATDTEGRRIFNRPDLGISAMAIDEKTDWQLKALATEGDVGPGSGGTTAMSANGTILQWEGSALRSFDAANPKARWERFGTNLVPTEVAYSDGGRTLAFDATAGDWLVTNCRTSDPKSTFDTYAVSADAKSFTKIATTGTVPRRASAASIAVGGKLYVIAGSDSLGGDALDDVWVLDRKTNAWKELGKLPQAILWPSVRQVSPTELWVFGMTKLQQANEPVLSSVIAIDLVTGNARALATHGDPGPANLWTAAPLGTGFIGFESGNTIDATQPNLWTVTKDGDGVIWKSTPIDANDYGLNGLHGVGRGDGTAYFVGQHLWQATITAK